VDAGQHDGLNSPSGVTRVLMTGYYDGATNGLLQFGEGGPVFRFDLADGGDDNGTALLRDERTFTLRPLPADALDRFVAALAPYMAPRWPAWCPVWQFPSPEIRQVVERQTDAILAQAGPPEWTVSTSDYFNFSAFRAEHVRAGQQV
jgi:hypothetical protein